MSKNYKQKVMQVILIIISKYIFNLDLRYLYCRYTLLFTEKLGEKATIDIHNALIFYNYKDCNKKIDQVCLGLFLTNGLVDDLLDVIDPIFGLLVCRSFTHIVVLIPRVLMEDFHFSIGHFFRVFDTDKAVALFFNSRTVKKSTNTQEAGLFDHYYINFFKKPFCNTRIKRCIDASVKINMNTEKAS